MYRRDRNIPVRSGKSNRQAGHSSSLEFALPCTHRITGPLLSGRALHAVENRRHGCNAGGRADDCGAINQEVEVRAPCGTLVGKQKWILVTTDQRQRTKHLERYQIVRHRVREFLLTEGDWGKRV